MGSWKSVGSRKSTGNWNHWVMSLKRSNRNFTPTDWTMAWLLMRSAMKRGSSRAATSGTATSPDNPSDSGGTSTSWQHPAQ